TFSASFSFEPEHNEQLSEIFQGLNGLRILHVCNLGKGSLSTGRMLSSFGMKVSSVSMADTFTIKEPEYDLLLVDVSIDEDTNIEDVFNAGFMKTLAGIPAILFTSDREHAGTDS